MMRYFLLLSCFIVSSTTLYSQNDPCLQRKCLAIVDAGSTGSRLHVYAYDTDETNTPIHINEVWTKKGKPGFATIEATKENIALYLNNLFSDSPTAHVPVYFYATAGMRLLPPQKQQKYYHELKNWFTAQTQWQLKDSKTITGNDEALYDWLSVNYHLGTLTNPNKSVGVMDMGGASVQIVFPVQENLENNKNQTKVHLYGKDITLSAHSFLGLGQTEVSHQFLNSSACFSNNFPLPSGELGLGNAFLCEQEVAPLMNAVHGVNSIQPLLAANPVDSWYAIGGISNLADNQKLFHFESNQLTLRGLLTQADSGICHQQWDTLNTQFPDDGYVYGYCLFSAYFYALIIDGYGLSPEQPVNYLPPKLDIDWTKGVVLAHSSSNEKSSAFNVSQLP